jgi:hypothetical protein
MICQQFAQIKENMGDMKFNFRYVNSIISSKKKLQDKLEELSVLNRMFFGKRSVRVSRL